MSMIRTKSVICPKCGHANDFPLWHSLNSTIHPDAKQRLLDGSLFAFTCGSCHHESLVDYPMLYHDMEHRIMIWYVNGDSLPDTSAAITDTGKALGLDRDGYVTRIVTSQNSLREKAIIFNSGLDDRIVEIIKLMYSFSAAEQFPDAPPLDVYFYASEGKYSLEFTGSRQLHADISGAVYNSIRDSFAHRLAYAGNAENRIDMSWAANFIAAQPL